MVIKMKYRAIKVSNVEDYLSQAVGDNSHGDIKFTNQDGLPASNWYLHSIAPSIIITDNEGKSKVEQWLIILYFHINES